MPHKNSAMSTIDNAYATNTYSGSMKPRLPPRLVAQDQSSQKKFNKYQTMSNEDLVVMDQVSARKNSIASSNVSSQGSLPLVSTKGLNLRSLAVQDNILRIEKNKKQLKAQLRKTMHLPKKQEYNRKSLDKYAEIKMEK